MEYIFWILILCVIPTIVTPITISSNGNSPEIKMFGRPIRDLQKGTFSSSLKAEERPNKKTLDGTNSFKINSTKLAINERYRRLIPYMTFYYANDLPVSTTETYNTKSIEVEKAQILEAGSFEEQSLRRPKVVHSAIRHHSIPRYQGNRLTHFNIASANPTKVFYNKDGYPIVLQNAPKVLTNYNPLDQNIGQNDQRASTPKEINGLRLSYAPIRKQYLNHNQNENENVQYYFPEKEEIKYKLVPYQQTPPIKNQPDTDVNNTPKYYSTASAVPKDSTFIKPRPRPQYHFDEIASQRTINRKPPATISEVYFERQKPISVISEPIIETGFKPIMGQTTETSDKSIYTSSLAHYENEKPQELQEHVTEAPVNNDQKQYFQYVTQQPSNKPQPTPDKSITLAELLNSLQLNKSIPKLITKENVGSSIRILLQALNTLKGKFLESEVTSPVLSSPAPFEVPKIEVTTIKPIIHTAVTTVEETDLNEDTYLAEVENPSQYLDDYTSISQQFPLPISSDAEGGTPGRPGLDYPILTTIPITKFDCKTQRYKGFFADPDTRCQVWHYCDLNGGQASFLCPNGTIFSQAALTCDWWFNVKCSSTAQLYVLNESLYKYILPHSPKFPEDFSGPLVDKYLTLKFKEMEEEFKKNKNKQSASEKIDTDEDKSSNEDKNVEESNTTNKGKESVGTSNTNEVSKSSVIVATSGASGNVERLEV